MLALHLRVPPSLCERLCSFYSQLYIPNFPHCLYITQGTPFVVVVPCTGFYASRGLQWAGMICPVSLVHVCSHQRRLVKECWGSDLQLYNNRFPVRVVSDVFLSVYLPHLFCRSFWRMSNAFFLCLPSLLSPPILLARVLGDFGMHCSFTSYLHPKVILHGMNIYAGGLSQEHNKASNCTYSSSWGISIADLHLPSIDCRKSMNGFISV